jgi:acetyl-CoA carboxylase biotin carboxyl carrier protein
MTPEESKELAELVQFLKENKINEFDFERGDLKVRIKFETQTQGFASVIDQARLWQMVAAAQTPLPSPGTAARAGASAGSPPDTDEPAEDAGLHIVKSPIVGTFYESPSPGAGPFVRIGDQVENGQVLCIVEAMKLMNEIEADAAGEVVKRLVANGQPVEYGQPLFALRSH